MSINKERYQRLPVSESDDDTDREVEAQPLTERKKRTSKAPSRFRKDFIPSLSKHEVLSGEVKVVVRCSQYGDRFVKRVAELSTPDDDPLSKVHLKSGTSLVAEIDGCPYPVEMIGTTDEMKKKTKTQTQSNPKALEKKILDRKRKILDAACDENEQPESSTSASKKLKRDQQKPAQDTGNFEIAFTKEDHDMLLDIHSMLKKVVRKQASDATAATATCTGKVKVEAEEDRFTVNGVNLLSLRARDVFQYALVLMDTLFERDEMAGSLVKKTKRSDKPALNEEIIQLIEDCLERKFGGDFDRRAVLAKMNQK